MKKKDIKSYTGKDGKSAYIVYNGKVYDVTDNKHWKDGVHMARHQAGVDLTDFMTMAPHGDEVLENVVEVSKLENDDSSIKTDRKQVLRDLYNKYHPHPIMIHFPIGLFIFAAFMQALFLVTGIRSFESSSFYSLIFATVTSFPSVITGFFSWWINYELTTTKIFKNKIIYSIILLATGTFAVVLRSIYSSLSFGSGPLFIFYFILVMVNVPITLFIAYNGGKITWPS